MLCNWPVASHMIRFATGVHKHQSVCMLSRVLSMEYLDGRHAVDLKNSISAMLVVSHASMA